MNTDNKSINIKDLLIYLYKVTGDGEGVNYNEIKYHNIKISLPSPYDLEKTYGDFVKVEWVAYQSFIYMDGQLSGHTTRRTLYQPAITLTDMGAASVTEGFQTKPEYINDITKNVKNSKMISMAWMEKHAGSMLASFLVGVILALFVAWLTTIT